MDLYFPRTKSIQQPKVKKHATQPQQIFDSARKRLELERKLALRKSPIKSRVRPLLFDLKSDNDNNNTSNAKQTQNKSSVTKHSTRIENAPTLTPFITEPRDKSSLPELKPIDKSKLIKIQSQPIAQEHLKRTLFRLPSLDTESKNSEELIDDNSVNKQQQHQLVTAKESKISSGPLKGVSSSLLDKIRAKEAALKAISPQKEREKELMGFAPVLIRIVFTIFTSSKKEYLHFDKIVDKCFNGLNSDYTSSSIIECLDLMNKVTPDWTTTVDISRGRFMRLNKTKYSMSQLLEAVQSFKITLGDPV